MRVTVAGSPPAALASDPDAGTSSVTLAEVGLDAPLAQALPVEAVFG